MQNNSEVERKKMSFKCKRCRHLLFSDKELSDTHNKPLNETESHDCTSNNVWYLREDVIPSWITNQIDAYDWTKGKLHCVTCGCRIGSFDFVSGSKCKCGSSVLPAVHVVASKVDCQVTL